MDLGKSPRDNDLITIFVIGFIRTSRQSFTSHVGIGSTAQKALDGFFSNCLYLVIFNQTSNVITYSSLKWIEQHNVLYRFKNDDQMNKECKYDISIHIIL